LFLPEESPDFLFVRSLDLSSLDFSLDKGSFRSVILDSEFRRWLEDTSLPNFEILQVDLLLFSPGTKIIGDQFELSFCPGVEVFYAIIKLSSCWICLLIFSKFMF